MTAAERIEAERNARREQRHLEDGVYKLKQFLREAEDSEYSDDVRLRGRAAIAVVELALYFARRCKIEAQRWE
jgi:hypothetical protein